jgi:thioredoxin-dependent peroxiredoxin
MIEINTKAPEFTLPDFEGNNVSLSDFTGKSNVVIVMYPGDDTPGCTAQLCAIRDDAEQFKSANTVVLGINHEDADSHKGFVEKYGLTTKLLVDAGRKVIEGYGALGSFLGNATTKRTVVAIDSEGIIRGIWKGSPSTEEILAPLKNTE